jgi:hypothetical protein
MTNKSLENAKKQSKKWHHAIKNKVLRDPEVNETYERTLQEIELTLALYNARDISQKILKLANNKKNI